MITLLQDVIHNSSFFLIYITVSSNANYIFGISFFHINMQL